MTISFNLLEVFFARVLELETENRRENFMPKRFFWLPKLINLL